LVPTAQGRFDQDIGAPFRRHRRHLPKRKLDTVTLQEREDLLIQADLGVETAMRITEALAKGRFNKEIAPAEVRAVLAAEVERTLAPVAKPLRLEGGHRPHVILVVGVNGTGKTTTIGKLAHKLVGEGKKATMAAGDTFRAAAVEQLKIWGERTGTEVVARAVGADSAGRAHSMRSTGAREWQRCVAYRHRRPVAEQTGTDGGAREGHSRARQDRSERAASGAPGARCDHRSKRP
jgi:signal recognition particle GTPase